LYTNMKRVPGEGKNLCRAAGWKDPNPQHSDEEKTLPYRGKTSFTKGQNAYQGHVQDLAGHGKKEKEENGYYRPRINPERKKERGKESPPQALRKGGFILHGRGGPLRSFAKDGEKSRPHHCTRKTVGGKGTVILRKGRFGGDDPAG